MVDTKRPSLLINFSIACAIFPLLFHFGDWNLKDIQKQTLCCHYTPYPKQPILFFALGYHKKEIKNSTLHNNKPIDVNYAFQTNYTECKSDEKRPGIISNQHLMEEYSLCEKIKNKTMDLSDWEIMHQSKFCTLWRHRIAGKKTAYEYIAQGYFDDVSVAVYNKTMNDLAFREKWDQNIAEVKTIDSYFLLEDSTMWEIDSHPFYEISDKEKKVEKMDINFNLQTLLNNEETSENELKLKCIPIKSNEEISDLIDYTGEHIITMFVNFCSRCIYMAQSLALSVLDAISKSIHLQIDMYLSLISSGNAYGIPNSNNHSPQLTFSIPLPPLTSSHSDSSSNTHTSLTPKTTTNSSISIFPNKEEIIYWRFHLPWPIQPRDFVYARRVATIPESNSVITVQVSTKHKNRPIKKKYVRIEEYNSTLTLYPTNSLKNPSLPGMEYILYHYDDSKVILPDWVTSYITAQMIPSTMKALYEVTKTFTSDLNACDKSKNNSSENNPSFKIKTNTDHPSSDLSSTNKNLYTSQPARNPTLLASNNLDDYTTCSNSPLLSLSFSEANQQPIHQHFQLKRDKNS